MDLLINCIGAGAGASFLGSAPPRKIHGASFFGKAHEWAKVPELLCLQAQQEFKDNAQDLELARRWCVQSLS